MSENTLTPEQKEELYKEFIGRKVKEDEEKSKTEAKKEHDEYLSSLLEKIPEANREKVKSSFEELTGGQVFKKTTIDKHFKTALSEVSDELAKEFAPDVFHKSSI
jgi:hypothetical protein